MKIGFVVTDLFQMGGVERVVLLLSRIFCDILHHEVTIFSCLSRPGEGKLFFECPDKVKIVHLSKNLDPDSWLVKNSFSQKTFLKLRVLSELKKYQKDHPHDILISTICWCNCLLPFFGKPSKIIACDHCSFKFVPWLYRMVSRICYPHLDALVSLTERNLQLYTFVKKQKQFVVPNPCSFVSSEQSSCQKRQIICFARFTYQKGLDELLQIAATLKDQIPDWQISIYGSGEDENSLLDLRKNLNLEEFVHFHPATNQVKEKLCESSMYVMTSRFEGLPMTLIEAQLCGVPIVSYDCDCGPSDIINNDVDGCLIPYGNQEAFVQAVVKLANDEDLRRRFGAAAKINSQRFAPEKIAEIWQQLFDRLMQS